MLLSSKKKAPILQSLEIMVCYFFFLPAGDPLHINALNLLSCKPLHAIKIQICYGKTLYLTLYFLSALLSSSFFFPSASTKTLTQGKRTPHSFVAGDTVLLLLPVKMKLARHLPPLMQEARDVVKRKKKC